MPNIAKRCAKTARDVVVWTMLAVAMVIPAVAAAVGPVAYVGVGTGPSDSNVDRAGIRQLSGPFVTITADESDSALRVFGGLRISRFFGVEMGYADLGTTTATALPGGFGGDRYKFAVSGLEISALGIVPLGKVVDLYGRLGGYLWISDFTVTRSGITVKDSVTGGDLVLGGGAMVNLGKHFALRFDYARYDVDENNAGAGNYSVATGNLMVRF